MSKRVYSKGFRAGRKLTMCEYLVHWIKTPRTEVEDWLCSEGWDATDTTLACIAAVCVVAAGVLIGLLGF